MDARTATWTGLATLIVALLTLAIAATLLIRPGQAPAPDAGPSVVALQDEIEGLRDDIAELRAIVETTTGPAQPVDLSALETRLGRLEGAIAAMEATVDEMNATARTICQLVADSPFTPSASCGPP